MKTHALILAALLSTPLAARADRSPEEQQARHQRMEQHMRTMRVVGLAEALNLDEAGALKLDAQMRPFDERRSAIHEQMKADRELLEKAADGDPAAAGQVDAALARIFDNGAKLEQINREMLEALSKGLPPQQKAKLAVFLATFKHALEMGHGGMGMGPMGMHGKWRGGPAGEADKE
jgi:hypothetical protein